MSIFDAWTVLAFIGAKSTKVRLGSGVTDIQRIHPAKTANIVSTLDNLTNGRGVLGIGTGEIMNTVPYGIEWEKKEIRLKRLREYLQVIKLLWGSSYEKAVNFSGEFYSLRDAQLSLPPLQKPNPPIYIGSWSSKEMLRIVGELADGWYPASHNTPELFKERVQIIKDAAQKANRSFDRINIIANVPTLVCKDQNQITQLKGRIKNALKRKLLLNQYFWKVLGLTKDDLSTPRELEYQFASPGPNYDKTLSKAVENLTVPDEALERAIGKIIAVGSIDECVSTIEKFVQSGATNIFFSDFLSTKENYHLIGTEIIPRLRNL